MKTIFKPKVLLRLSCIAVCTLFFVSCKKYPSFDPINRIQPHGPVPKWGPTINPQMLAVIEKLESFNAPPIYTLTPEEARKQPGAADAAMAVMKDYHIPAPPMKVDTSGIEIPVTGGTIHARVYTPKTGRSSYPVILYYHGGGWVIATIDTYNSSAQALAEQTDAIVISVEYRKGPEYKFPTAHNDAYEAYVWAYNNAASIKGNPQKMAVAGESAGGNLAINVSKMAKDNGVKMPLHQVLVYPVANNDTTAASVIQYQDALPLNKPSLLWFFKYYLNNPDEGNDPRISLVDVANLAGLPPTTLIAAEIDPLQTEGKLLADKLAVSGVNTTYKLFKGVTHEFYGMNTVLHEAQEAEALAAWQLRKAFK